MISLHVAAEQLQNQSYMRRMSWVLAILLLAISKTVVSQCDYIYVAEPPAGQLICDPFPINQLQLVCSIFVADVRQVPGDLIIQWFFSMPVNRQFSPANAVLLQQVRFPVVQQETFTSRIAVRQLFRTIFDGYMLSLNFVHYLIIYR